MSDALATVIITWHRYTDGIQAAIDSVRRQTLNPPPRIILVDDSATQDVAPAMPLDPTPDALLTTGNQGPAGARHAGIMMCQTPWFLWLDSDDQLEPNHLEALLNAAQHLHAAGAKPAFLYGNIQRFGDLDTVARQAPADIQTLKDTNCIGGGVLINRAAYMALHADGTAFNPNRNWGYGEDWDLYLSFLEHGYNGAYIPWHTGFRYHVGFTDSLSFYTTRFERHYLALIRSHHPSLYPETREEDARTLSEMWEYWYAFAPRRTLEEVEWELKKAPQNIHLRYLRGLHLIRAGHYAAAQTELEALSDPQPAVALKFIAAVRQLQTTHSDQHITNTLRPDVALLAVLCHEYRGTLATLPSNRLEVVTLAARMGCTPAARFLAAHARRETALWDSLSANDPNAPLGVTEHELHGYHNQASRLKSAGQLKEAEAMFQRLREHLDRRLPNWTYERAAARFHLGEIAWQSGLQDEAVTWFKDCLALLPNHHRAAEYLDRAGKEKGK